MNADRAPRRDRCSLVRSRSDAFFPFLSHVRLSNRRIDHDIVGNEIEKRERKKGEKEARKKRKETLKGRVKQKMHITAESCWTQRNNAVSNFDVWTFPNPISAKTASHCNGALALRTAWRLSARNRVPRSLHRLKLGRTQTARRLHADCTQASRAVHFSS